MEQTTTAQSDRLRVGDIYFWRTRRKLVQLLLIFPSACLCEQRNKSLQDVWIRDRNLDQTLTKLSTAAAVQSGPVKSSPVLKKTLKGDLD